MLIASGGILFDAGAIAYLLAYFLLVPCLGVAIAFYGRFFARKNTGAMRRVGLIITIIGISIPILFCGSFINFNNREPASRKLQKGMTHDEVFAIMGNPDLIQSDAWLYYEGLTKFCTFGVIFDENNQFDHISTGP